MDQTDRAIIEQLRQNGRLSNAELADRVNLTPAPCLRRVRRLEADGVITGYHAHVDPEAVGQGFEVIVQVELDSRDRDAILSVEQALVELPEVIEARRMFGALDHILRVAAADIDSYETFAIDRLQAIRGIARVQSHITMKALKREYP
jgi:DNA-binding Lrp family transcriptional regulator